MSDMIKGTMISYRPDIKVLDATIRDGGLVNNFEFTDDFVRKLYLTNLRAGVDIMEIGYLADPELFEESKFGKWKFCTRTLSGRCWGIFSTRRCSWQ